RELISNPPIAPEVAKGRSPAVFTPGKAPPVKGFRSGVSTAPPKPLCVSFARTWTMDLKDRRIRVNAVSPGFIDTPPWHSTDEAEQLIKPISNTVPFGRFGTADEIAKTVVFLASDDSSYITGTELFVDGGSRKSDCKGNLSNSSSDTAAIQP